MSLFAKPFFAQDVEDTQKAAKAYADTLKGGEVLLLSGDLGAGKTTFVTALVGALGSPAHVSSPTYSLLHIYEGGRLPVYHYDLYRLLEPQSVEDAGLNEYFLNPNLVCVLEWPGSALPFLWDMEVDFLYMEKVKDDVQGNRRVLHFQKVKIGSDDLSSYPLQDL